MSVKENDWIKIHYTLKYRNKEGKETVIETTKEPVAKESGIYNEETEYEPSLMKVGDDRYTLKGLENKLVGLELHKEVTFEVPAEEAYGKKNTQLIEMIPLRTLRKIEKEIYVGKVINYKDRKGVITWIGSGRARVDFNHPLAGKDLIYDVEVFEILENEKQIIDEVILRRFPKNLKSLITIEQTSEDPKTIVIKFPYYFTTMNNFALVSLTIAEELYNSLNFDLVRFIYEFDFRDRKKDKATEETSTDSEANEESSEQTNEESTADSEE